MDTESLSPFHIDKRLAKGFDSFAGLSARYLDPDPHQELMNDVGHVTSPHMASKWLRAEPESKNKIILSCLSDTSVASLNYIGICAHRDDPHFTAYTPPRHKIFSNSLTDLLLDFVEHSDRLFWKIQKKIFAVGGLVGAVALISNNLVDSSVLATVPNKLPMLKALTSGCLVTLKYGAFANVAYAIGGSLLNKINTLLIRDIKRSIQSKEDCAQFLGYLLEHPEKTPSRQAAKQRAGQPAAPTR